MIVAILKIERRGDMRGEDINAISSESGVIASLIHNPDFSFYSEHLLPNHFTNVENRYIYLAISELAKKGIKTVDPYNIIEILHSSEATKRCTEFLTVDKLHELMEMSDVLARKSVEEYMVCVKNVVDAAFKRDTFKKLRECQAICCEDESKESVEKRIYEIIDGVMTEFSVTNEIPEYKDVIDDCWEEIKERQDAGCSGIPFKFPTLNEYVSIEKGELVIFAAEAKQGKSMFLLNCAMDLLKQDKAVLYLDSELNTRMFTARVLAHLTGIEYRRLVTGCYNKDEADMIEAQMNWLKTRNFTHIYVPLLDLQSIYTAVKKVQHTHGLDVLVVDYFKSSGDGDAWSSYAELGRFVDMVKNQIAGDMGIAAIGAAQATSTGKVADSAKIGRNASTICLIQDKTPEEVDMDGVECGNKKLRVILNRNGMQMAPDEYLDLQFDGNHILYTEAKQHTPHVPF